MSLQFDARLPTRLSLVWKWTNVIVSLFSPCNAMGFLLKVMFSHKNNVKNALPIRECHASDLTMSTYNYGGMNFNFALRRKKPAMKD